MADSVQKFSIAQSAQDGFNAWYKSRACRRIFLLSFLLSIGLLILWQISGADFIRIGFVVVACIAIGASIYDTNVSRGMFNSQIEIINKNYKIQQAEAGDPTISSPFTPDELRQIKIQKTKFLGVLGIKIMIAIFLLAIVFGGGVS